MIIAAKNTTRKQRNQGRPIAIPLAAPVVAIEPISSVTNQPPRDIFRLRYFKFSCKSIDKTIMFYTNLGMTLQIEKNQEKTVPILKATGLTNNRSTAPIDDSPIVSPVVTNQTAKSISDFAGKQTVLIQMGFKNELEVKNNKVSLQFEVF